MTALLYNGCQVTVEAAFDDQLFAASPSWTDITSYVRGPEGMILRRSGRTSEIDAFQPGNAEIVCNLRNRALDPTYGPASVTFDGSGGDYWSCGDVAALSGATELDIRFALSMDDWTPATEMTLVSQWGAAGQRAFRLYNPGTTGVLTFVTSNDGTATANGDSQVQFCAVDGQVVAGKVTWTTAGTASFYIKRSTKDRVVQDARSHDNWVLVGSDATAGTAALFNSTTDLRVGLLGGGTSPLDGVVYYLSVATTLDDDTPAVVFWPKDAASSSSTSWTGSEDGLSWTQGGTTVVDPQGTYYGRLLPGTPIRVSATYNAVTYRLWYGYLRRAVLSYPGNGKDAIVRLQASDALAWLLDRQAPDTPYGIGLDTVDIRPSSYWPLHEPITSYQFSDVNGEAHGEWSVTSASGAASQPASSLPTRALSLVAPIANSNVYVEDLDVVGGQLVELCFWVHLEDVDDVFRVYVSDGTYDLGIDYGASGTYMIVNSGAGTAYTFGERVAPGAHFVQLVFNSTIMVAGFIGETAITTSGTAALPTINSGLFVQGSDGVTISDVSYGMNTTDPNVEDASVAGYNGRYGDTGAERIGWLLTAAGVPAGLQDLDTTAATYMGATSSGGTYGELCRQVNAAEAGRFYVAGDGSLTFRSRVWAITDTAATTSQGTFSDTFVDIALQPADVSDVVNSATVTLPDGSAGSYRDSESIALYGVQSQSFSAPCASPEDAQSLARYYVGLRNHPHARVSSVALKPRHPTHVATLFPQVLGRDIGERITVTRNVTGTLSPSSTTTAISAAVTIEGITHRITEDDWVTTWTTVPAPPTSAEAGYFTLDDAALGLLDAGLSFAP